MKKKLLFCALVLTSSTFAWFGSSWLYQQNPRTPYQKIDQYREVEAVFNACDKQTLITFDVDDTLITGVDDVIARDGVWPLWFTIRVAFKHPTIVFKRERVTSILVQTEHFVFDQDIIRFIQQLRRQDCPVIALTAMRSGSLDVIKSLSEWRACMLQGLGIDLRGKFQDTVFTTFPQNYGGYPLLHNGIVFANRQPKGTVLGAFLDYSHLKPDRIISFDDSTDFLESIAKECARRGILFTGYQVMGAKKLRGPWNNRRALFQLDYLMAHEQWLTDKQADAMLAGNPG